MSKDVRKPCKWNKQYKRDISCTRFTCDGCSWDPKVHEERVAAIREREKTGTLIKKPQLSGKTYESVVYTIEKALRGKCRCLVVGGSLPSMRDHWKFFVRIFAELHPGEFTARSHDWLILCKNGSVIRFISNDDPKSLSLAMGAGYVQV